MSESMPPGSAGEGPDSPHVLAVTECEDRMEVQGRVVRRHFWRRLLPGVGVTSYMAASVATGLGTPALVVTAVFAAFTAREALTFRTNLSRLRALEAELASLKAGGSASVGRTPPGSGSTHHRWTPSSRK